MVFGKLSVCVPLIASVMFTAPPVHAAAELVLLLDDSESTRCGYDEKGEPMHCPEGTEAHETYSSRIQAAATQLLNDLTSVHRHVITAYTFAGSPTPLRIMGPSLMSQPEWREEAQSIKDWPFSMIGKTDLVSALHYVVDHHSSGCLVVVILTDPGAKMAQYKLIEPIMEAHPSTSFHYLMTPGIDDQSHLDEMTRYFKEHDGVVVSMLNNTALLEVRETIREVSDACNLMG